MNKLKEVLNQVDSLYNTYDSNILAYSAIKDYKMKIRKGITQQNLQINETKNAINTIFSVKECQLIGSYYVGVADVHSDLDVIVMVEDAHLILNKLKGNHDLIKYSLEPFDIPNFSITNHSTSVNTPSFDPDKHLGVVKIMSLVGIDVLIYGDPVKFEAAKFANEASYTYNKLNQNELKDKLERVIIFNKLFNVYTENTHD